MSGEDLAALQADLDSHVQLLQALQLAMPCPALAECLEVAARLQAELDALADRQRRGAR